MARLTVRLPETLHEQLVLMAEREGVSLNQFITYTLTRQLAGAYSVTPVSDDATHRQRSDYAMLLESLGKASYSEVKKTLAERTKIDPEAGLTQDVVLQLRERIAKYGSEC